MRLIDADALKETLSNNEAIRIFNLHYDGLIAEIIDNAPTLESDIEVATKDAYEQGYTDGWKERFGEPNERPQGKWKLHGMIYYCSVCGHDYEQGGNNFCGNCGADMRGEEDAAN